MTYFTSVSEVREVRLAIKRNLLSPTSNVDGNPTQRVDSDHLFQ